MLKKQSALLHNKIREEEFSEWKQAWFCDTKNIMTQTMVTLNLVQVSKHIARANAFQQIKKTQQNSKKD